MAIIPETLEEIENDVLETEMEIQPSLTYQLTASGLGGIVDGKEAIRQFIVKAIRTARSRFLIYDDQYGSEIEDLIGADVTRELLDEEIPRVIREALIYDDRIADVTNFNVSHSGDTVLIKFDVSLTNGERMESEVTI
ncbi:DUF2634 domain-containing protein [Psychrobacillus sp. OK032]|uniref:DUF2634 domain-containing protein n=1 Tax=Psychrobacillus sp. OK032 TaxID=1884358 RepID=UPI0008C85C7A|nr:DUF2634 domain-containing protein [Psychrobacillus sp. OK032]SER87205.1 Protein of unknown function [Psychrobacillus sp. OK032]